MKIAIAQTRSFKGNIEANIAKHKKLIALGIAAGADHIFFPELSLINYEPALAKELAIDPADGRLDDFQEISDSNHITIGVGMPTKGTSGILISMIIFQPGVPRQTYSKQHLHSDEVPFFTNGDTQLFIGNGNEKIAPGICYETSLAVHHENAYRNGTSIYVASVAKSAAGVERSAKIFSEMAKKYSMTVLLVNSLGPSDNFIGGGKSTIWDNKGELLAQLDDTHEGILLLDTSNSSISKEILP